MDDEKDDFEFEEDTLKRGAPTGDLAKVTKQPPAEPPKKSNQDADN